MTRPREEGFALIVIAALFMAFALVATTLIDRTNVTQQINQQEATRAQLARLSSALIKYSLFNHNRYPCPAGTDIAVTATAAPLFGQSIAGCQIDPLSHGVVGLSPTTIRGMVPVADLAPYGIDTNDAFDAWNNRIMYAVDRNMTPASAVAASTTGRPTITERNTALVFKDADFVLISYGRDGLGGIPRNMTAIAIPCPTDGTDRARNCKTNTSLLQAPPLTAPSATTAQYFDDILSFYTSATSLSCATASLPWMTNCLGSFPGALNGASSSALNTSAGYTGTATAVCTNGSWSVPVGTCTTVTGSSCPTTVLPWNTNCSGTFAGVASGQGSAATNTAANYTGTASATCTNGTWGTPVGTCTAVIGTCASMPLSWGAGCTATFPQTSIGSGASEEDNSGRGIGHAICTSTGWGSIGGACGLPL